MLYKCFVFTGMHRASSSNEILDDSPLVIISHNLNIFFIHVEMIVSLLLETFKDAHHRASMLAGVFDIILIQCWPIVHISGPVLNHRWIMRLFSKAMTLPLCLYSYFFLNTCKFFVNRKHCLSFPSRLYVLLRVLWIIRA